MPKIYRIMKAEDGKPVGDGFGELGVRPGKDIPIYEGLEVRPGEGGMSVGPSLREMPPLLVPKRLGTIVRGARGRNSHHCWTMGEGPYAPEGVSDDLRLRIETDTTHGFVEPARSMLLDVYQQALAATRPQWSVDEG